MGQNKRNSQILTIIEHELLC